MSLESPDLRATLQGDLGAFERLKRGGHDSLVSSEIVAPLSLTALAVRQVLIELQAGRIDPALAAEWAGLMRWGVLGQWSEIHRSSEVAADQKRPVQPLHIELEKAYEDEIIEALARLDEIDDDGPPSQDELAQLLTGLRGIGTAIP